MWRLEGGLGASWEGLRASWSILGCLEGVLRASWSRLGSLEASWKRLEGFWGRLGSVLERLAYTP